MTVVWRGDFPDPFVLRAGDRYYGYATQTGALDVQVMTSPDLRHWTHLGNALAALPHWAEPGRTWSPAVLARPRCYVLYYATRLRRTARQALSVAVADRAEGPFVDTSTQPLVYQHTRGGSIDPDPFIDRDGTAYLLWKSDDNALGGRTVLWVRQLRPDGLSFQGRPVKVLRQRRAWEEPIVEAPSLAYANGRYHLLYSGGRWESASYGVGHASGSGPTGPFTVTSTEGPWLHGPRGPGGQSIVADAAGGLHLAYHGARWAGWLRARRRAGVARRRARPLRRRSAAAAGLLSFGRRWELRFAAGTPACRTAKLNRTPTVVEPDRRDPAD